MSDEENKGAAPANAPAPANGANAPAPPVKSPTPASTAAPTAPLLNAQVPQVNRNVEEVQATDKHARPGGAYLVRGRWVDADNKPISEEEQAEFKLPKQSTSDDVPVQQPGAGQRDPAADERTSTIA